MNDIKWNNYLKEIGTFESEYSPEANNFENTDVISSDVNITIDLKDVVNVLCVGCGFGQEVLFFNKKGYKTVGVTLNDEDVKIANGMNLDVRKMDVHELQFEDESFDLVFVRQVFEHSLSHYIAMKESSRVVRDNKYVAIFLPYIYEWSKFEHHTLTPTKFQLECLASKFELVLIDHIVRIKDDRKWNDYIYLFKKVKA